MDLDALMNDLARSEDTAYVTSRDRRIVAVNDGWRRFAVANDGEEVLERCPLGYCVDDALPAVLRAFYVGACERALETGAPFVHDYECSSPDRLRRFHLVIYPLPGERLLFVHSLIEEAEHTRRAREAEAQGRVVTMCSHCRRVKRAEGTWDWVPAFIAAMPPNTSHGLCEPCFHFYYPEV